MANYYKVYLPIKVFGSTASISLMGLKLYLIVGRAWLEASVHWGGGVGVTREQGNRGDGGGGGGG